MAIAQRKPVASPSVPEGPRAKSLRPFERPLERPLRSETREVLAAFEAAVLSGDEGRIRASAAHATDELLVEARRGSLPEDLAGDVERWDEGEFRGTRVDVELANHALAVLLGSPVRVDEPVADDEVAAEG